MPYHSREPQADSFLYVFSYIDRGGSLILRMNGV
jgi:hypothetical protein